MLQLLQVWQTYRDGFLIKKRKHAINLRTQDKSELYIQKDLDDS